MSAPAASGALRIEIQGPAGTPLPSFAPKDCPEVAGADLARTIKWQRGADLFALRFRP